jgi:hypothetical protein
VPYFKILPNGDIEVPDTERFLVEKPGLDIALLVGEEVLEDNDEDDLYG